MKPPRWKHQEQALTFAKDRPATLLSMHMGTGKSRVAVDLAQLKGHRRILIVCPVSVLGVWRREFAKHCTEPVEVLVLDKGTTKDKMHEAHQFVTSTTNTMRVVVVNYETAWREPFGSWAQRILWDLIIGDELHRAKSPTGKASKWLAKMRFSSKQRLGLTGTPMPHALPVDCPVLTPGGWRPIGEIQVDDYVIGKDGKPTKVVGVWPQGEQPIFLVRFCDQSTIHCTADHLWQVTNRGRTSRGLPPFVKSTEELSEPLPLPRSRTKYRDNAEKRLTYQDGAPRWSIPIMDAAEFAFQEIPLDPYLLGVLIGDGHLGHPVSFCTADIEMKQEVERRLPQGTKLVVHESSSHGKATDYRISTGKHGGTKGRHGPTFNPVTAALDDLGLRRHRSECKFVPPCYLWNSLDVRLEVLRGLCDTDGSSYGSTTRFTTTSKRLADDVVFLVRSLGGFVQSRMEKSCVKKLPQGTHVVGLPQHRLHFRVPHNPFRLSRKRDKWEQVWREPARNIVSIEPAGHADAQCITVESPDGLFVAKDFIVTHNSPLDIFAQYRFLDPDIFGRVYTHFRTRYAVVNQMFPSQVRQWINQEELGNKVASIAFQVGDEVLDLPPAMHETRTVELCPKAKKIYTTLEKELIAEVETGVISVSNALVKLLRLQQLTGGVLQLDNGQLVDIDDAKEKALLDLLEDLP